MNIYLNVEISARELDSKLLLAVLAAAKGHNVIISDVEILTKGLLRGWLPPGIFHTKSLTPSKVKIERHEKIIKNGSKVTSIDEEASIDKFGYKEFSNQRYSEKTIQQASAVFCWGEEDFKTLKKLYKKYAYKIYKTGSPRADLWKPFFSKYWKSSVDIIKKPFLLISSNMTVFERISFKERFILMRNTGYFDRDKKLLEETFKGQSIDYLKALVFIKAIKYLSQNNNGYEIVFRPHPTEDIETWKTLLNGIPRVHVIREGGISSWVKNAFAVMHHACTTAIETTISQKPIITFLADELKNHKYQNQLSNKLGYVVKTKKKLLNVVNNLFDMSQNKTKKLKILPIPQIIKNKIFFDKKEYAAEKIVNIWENLFQDNIYPSFSLIRLQFFIFKMKINKFIGYLLSSFLRFKKNKSKFKQDNSKFPPLNKDEVYEKIFRLKKLLKINRKIEIKIISEHTITLKPL